MNAEKQAFGLVGRPTSLVQLNKQAWRKPNNIATL